MAGLFHFGIIHCVDITEVNAFAIYAGAFVALSVSPGNADAPAKSANPHRHRGPVRALSEQVVSFQQEADQ